MKITIQVRILLAVIGITLGLIITQQVAHGKEWPTNYQHFTAIRDFVRDIPKGTELCFTLNDGRLVFGTFIEYEAYTDYIWYQPDGTGHNWFAQDAFDVHEIFRVDTVTKELV